MVHLVFRSGLPDPGPISFVFPGQSLILATLDREMGLYALEDRRMETDPAVVHMWSVPVGWEAPGLEAFLDRDRQGW